MNVKERVNCQLIVTKSEEKSRRLTAIRNKRKFPNTGPNTTSCKLRPPLLLANFPPLDFIVISECNFDAIFTFDRLIRTKNLAYQSENNVGWNAFSVCSFNQQSNRRKLYCKKSLTGDFLQLFRILLKSFVGKIKPFYHFASIITSTNADKRESKKKLKWAAKNAWKFNKKNLFAFHTISFNRT